MFGGDDGEVGVLVFIRELEGLYKRCRGIDGESWKKFQILYCSLQG